MTWDAPNQPETQEWKPNRRNVIVGYLAAAAAAAWAIQEIARNGWPG